MVSSNYIKKKGWHAVFFFFFGRGRPQPGLHLGRYEKKRKNWSAIQENGGPANGRGDPKGHTEKEVNVPFELH